MRAVDLDEVDDVGAVEHGHVDRLVARRGHVPRDALRLADQVKPCGERRAELEQGHAEPIPHRLARDGDQVRASHERDQQLVDGGAGQVQPLRHLAGRQLGAVQEQFENVERADDRRYHTGHVDESLRDAGPVSAIHTRNNT
nr:hypothetical protein GCM10020092_055460 [Actinoplanes digitatis]